MSKYLDENGVSSVIQEVRRRAGSGPSSGSSWEIATDSEICGLIAQLDAGLITVQELGWSVGDTRKVNLNSMAAGTYNNAQESQTARLIIMEIGSYNGVGHFIVGFKQCLRTSEVIGETSGSLSWNDSRGGHCCDAIFDNMFPSSIKPIFKTFTVTTATASGYGSNESCGTVDQNCKLSLFAEKEVFGVRANSHPDEFNSSKVHAQIEWFKNSNNLLKYRNQMIDIYREWTLRSPSIRQDGDSYPDSCFCLVTNVGRSYYCRCFDDGYYYFAPFGVI